MTDQLAHDAPRNLAADANDDVAALWLRPALGFAAGVLVGWLLIGWWLWPVRWADASVSDLAPDVQASYVQMVADLYQQESGREDRLARARNRLESFDAVALPRVLGQLVVAGNDPVDAQHVRLLAAALEVVPGRVETDTTGQATTDGQSEPAPAAGLSSGVAEAARTVALAILVAALAAAASLGWAWMKWRREADPRAAGRRARAARRAAGGYMAPEEGTQNPGTERASDMTAALDLTGVDTAMAGESEHESETAQRVYDEGRGFTPLPRPEGETESLPLPRRLRGAGAPAWRPARIDLGDSAQVDYDGTDDRFFQTWLVYDERAGLVGSAGLKAQPVGSVNTLDLWFFERDEEGEPHERPMVTLLARPALSEPVLRARLRDRELLPAVPGSRTTLHAGELTLEVLVEAVEPDPDEEELALRHVRLRLTPRREDHADDIPAAAAPDPPVPLPFRRE